MRAFDGLIYTSRGPYLNGQVGDDGPLVSLQRLQGDLSDLGLGLPHEHLAGRSQHLFILTLDLHLEENQRLVYCQEDGDKNHIAESSKDEKLVTATTQIERMLILLHSRLLHSLQQIHVRICEPMNVSTLKYVNTCFNFKLKANAD